MDKEGLLAFEDDIRTEFTAGRIRYPVHFSKGNEEQLLQIFKLIEPCDWVFSTHRSHYHALLKGIPPEWIKDAIKHGCSMHLMNAEYRFFASAIVGGSISIALGVAMGIKRRGGTEKVWCFVGDMAASTGLFYESMKYAQINDLPITFVIEDNGLSTTTPTWEAWGYKEKYIVDFSRKEKYIAYQYKRLCPHINTESWVEFR